MQLEIPFPAKVLSVKDLTQHVKSILEKDSFLNSTWVQGEVSNLVKAASGHCYFTLKDDKAVVKAALWAGNRRRIKHEFHNGDKVMVFGSVSVYPPRGEYQIIVADLRPSGIGALYEAYEKLKKKLEAEGLFDPAGKLPLPFLPKGVGVVTSATGSVIKDIFRVIRRRFVNMPVWLAPARVQGEGAAEEIVAGMELLNRFENVDVIIVARGGGSLEDLWPFNEEKVARAIWNSKKPVISAVGHETDTTIADLVADRRAATPSVAGELVVPVKAELIEYLSRQKTRLQNLIKMRLNYARQSFNRLVSCRFLKNPSLLVAERRISVMNLARHLDSEFKAFVGTKRHEYALLAARLAALNPAVLIKRGYIMATDIKGHVITSVKKLKPEQKISLQFADGRSLVKIEKITEGEI